MVLFEKPAVYLFIELSQTFILRRQIFTFKTIVKSLSRIQQRAIDKDPDSREDPIPAAKTSLLNFSSPVTNSSNFCNKLEQRAGILPFSKFGFAGTEEESKIKLQELHPVAITTT